MEAQRAAMEKRELEEAAEEEEQKRQKSRPFRMEQMKSCARKYEHWPHDAELEKLQCDLIAWCESEGRDFDTLAKSGFSAEFRKYHDQQQEEDRAPTPRTQKSACNFSRGGRTSTKARRMSSRRKP